MFHVLGSLEVHDGKRLIDLPPGSLLVSSARVKAVARSVASEWKQYNFKLRNLGPATATNVRTWAVTGDGTCVSNVAGGNPGLALVPTEPWTSPLGVQVQGPQPDELWLVASWRDDTGEQREERLFQLDTT